MSGITDRIQKEIDKKVKKYLRGLGLRVKVDIVEVKDRFVILIPKVIDRDGNDVWVYRELRMTDEDSFVMSGLDIQFTGETIQIDL